MGKSLIVTNTVGQSVAKTSTDTFQSCIQCGLCAGICPWNYLEENVFNIRKVIRLVQLGGEGFEREDILYACTTCNLCGSVCPRRVEIADFIRGCRRLIADTGFIPSAFRDTLFSIRTFGNPWSQEKENRSLWTRGLEIPAFNNHEYLLWTCCTNSFDNKRHETLRSLARLLRKAGISFGIAGEEENCCGESIRRIGCEEDFQALAQKNIKLLKDLNVEKVLTVSPHCYYAFKCEYSQFEDQIEFTHYMQLLETVISEGRLKPEFDSPIKVSYHDPCYFGRYSNIYDPPRNVINSIEGIQFLELSSIKDRALCCGGGGGGIWLGGKANKLADIRIEDATRKGVDILVSSCPYCLNMLDYSNEMMGEEMRVMDIAQLLDVSC